MKTKLLEGTLLASAWLAFSTATCAAQTVEPPLPPTPAPAAGTPVEAARNDNAQLADIVVTAQRRSESAQRVPIAIAAFSAEQLRATGTASLPQIAQLTPGLQFQSVGSASVPFLRGVGNTSTVIGSEAATAIYVDGVYVSNQSVAYMSLPNVASIEVAKGPQGTLFGRNATAGVIQIRTRRPSQNTAVELNAGYGNYDTFEGSLYATTGLSNNAAIDLSLYGLDQRKGWGKNLVNGQDVFTHSDYAARSRLLFTPTTDTEVNVAIDFERITNDVGFANRLPRAGELGQTERALLTGYQFTGGFYDVAQDFDSGSRTKTYSASLDVLHHFGKIDVRSITAGRRTTVDQFVDFDVTPAPNAALILPISDRTFSQELQILSSENSDSAFKWIAGLYYYYQKGRYDGQQYGTLFTLPPALAAEPTQRIFLDSTQTTNSYAAFGQGTYALGGATNLTAGLRYTSDRRCLDATQSNPAFATPLLPLHQEGCQTFPKLTWRGALDHRFSKNVMVYAQYSRGFKSGYFNSQSLQSAPGGNRSVPLAVLPETIDAYEVGFKSDLLDRRLRLNMSAFYYDYKNLQVNAFIDPTNRITINAAAATIKGLEAEIQLVPVSGLNLSFSGAYLQASYEDFPGAPTFTPRTGPPWGLAVSQFNAAGNDLPNSPRFSGSASATYRTEGFGGKFSFNSTLYYNSGFSFDPQNRLKQSQFALLSGNIGWSTADDHFAISVWGNNLTNRRVLATANPIAGGDALTPRSPRTYGVRLSAKF